ncbi:MAG: protein-tyrosine-phosphatase [Bacteroidia bacterium]
MFTPIKNYCDRLLAEFSFIPDERKELLGKIAAYISAKQLKHEPVNLIYICTHNSRRSHFGQVWSTVAAHYFKTQNVRAFSGGTEVSAFNVNAINALKRNGFNITAERTEKNPVYSVFYAGDEPPVPCFSKIYNDTENPTEKFAAIMTCSEAEENCPFIPAAELRIATTYEDPKAFDKTPLQDSVYDSRCKQIALETFYAFSLVIPELQ